MTKHGKWRKDASDRGIIKRGRVFYIRFADANGNLHREAIGPSKPYAKKVLEKRKTEVREMRFFPEQANRGTSFEEIITAALEKSKIDHQRRYSGKKRFRDYRYGIICNWFPNRLASSIKPEEISAKVDEHCKGDSTARQYVFAISKAYELAIKARKAQSNPANGLELPILDAGRIRYLKADEEGRIRAAIQKLCPEHELEFDLALHTGMRFSEQYGLLWSDVDLDRKTIALHIPKSKKSVEYVYLNATALAALKAMKARGERVCGDYTEWDHRQWWHKVLQESKVTNFRWHDLRHTFASRLVMKDVNLITVSKLMRHATIEMTMKYAHLAPTLYHEAVEKLVSQ